MSYKHEIEVRVYYQDTDAQGIVYHANYLNFAERGRMEYFRSRDDVHKKLIVDKGLNTVIRHIDIEYFYPARLDDLVRVVTYIDEIRNSSFVVHADMFLGDRPLTSVKVTLVVVDKNFKPVRMPEDLRAIAE